MKTKKEEKKYLFITWKNIFLSFLCVVLFTTSTLAYYINTYTYHGGVIEIDFVPSNDTNSNGGLMSSSIPPVEIEDDNQNDEVDDDNQDNLEVQDDSQETLNEEENHDESVQSEANQEEQGIDNSNENIEEQEQNEE